MESLTTEIVRIDPDRPDAAALRRAGELIRDGQLVAFPTETVYGLGADALDAAAVARIFAAKGRPANNPIIVHVPHRAAAAELASAWPAAATALAERFWPGPLTLVLPRRPIVPDSVTAGRATVALRVPAGRVALGLLEAAGRPIAAPSANPSGSISPTRGEHVLAALCGRIAMILDAGPTTGGIESTVVDLSTPRPRLLRPGLVTRGEVEALIGPVETLAGAASPDDLASPGMLPRHYAPRARVEMVAGPLATQVERFRAPGRRIALVSRDPLPLAPTPDLLIVHMPPDAASYAQRLYATLHALDAANVDLIVVQSPPDGDEWTALRDRLQRAAWQP